MCYNPKFNQPLYLPPSLTSLSLDSCRHFSQPLSLPPPLTELTLPSSFNQPLTPQSLPLTLTLLNLTKFTKFSYPIRYRVLPNALTELSLGGDFNSELLPGVLPSSLTHLLFTKGSNFNQTFTINSLPTSLRKTRVWWLLKSLVRAGRAAVGFRIIDFCER